MGSCQSTAAAAATPKASKSNQETVILHEDRTESTARTNPKVLSHTHSSTVGLDTMSERRKFEGHLYTNVVTLEKDRNISEVYDGVDDGTKLGAGIAGLVRLVTHRATGIQYAVKCLDLELLGKEHQEEALRNEIAIMCQLDHPNIARLQEVYEEQTQIYLVQELGSGGELFDTLDEQPDYHYSEPEAVKLVHQMLSALRYLHSKDIIHRDLKLENFIFSTNKHAQLKMIDFGLSKHFDAGDIQHEAVGTPYTVAPEVLTGSYDEKCDLWAIGVIAFALLCGDTPFGGCGGPESLMDIRRNILEGRFKFEPEDVWEGISAEAKDFVKKLLLTDPNLRPSAEEAQRHPWIRQYHENGLHGERLSDKVIKSLVFFKDLSVTKRLIFEVLSFTLTPEQIPEMRIEFEKMDIESMGEISLDCMKQVLTRKAVNEDGTVHEGLSEAEVEEIFDALKVGKAEPRVHWHEFLAACLPECHVDERNLRIAFDRMDVDHNGFITFEEVIQLIARDADENQDILMKAWAESVEEYHCHMSQFSYEEFCHLVHAYL